MDDNKSINTTLSDALGNLADFNIESVEAEKMASTDSTTPAIKKQSVNVGDRRGFKKPKPALNTEDEKYDNNQKFSPQRNRSFKQRVPRFEPSDYISRDQSLELLFAPTKDHWTFKIGEKQMKVSTKFRVLQNEESRARKVFWLKKRTWRGTKLSSTLDSEENNLLVPSQEYSTTFIECCTPPQGTSAPVSIEPESPEVHNIIFGMPYERHARDGRVTKGIIVSHNGPIVVGFERDGRLSIEEDKRFFYRIAINGDAERVG